MLPKNILLLLAIPRSGSTMLFDALRYHPSIFVTPDASIFRRLKLSGRRYPKDLINLKGIQHQVIETHPGHRERIPRLGTDIDSEDTYAIEKFHPEFFRFNTLGFLERINTLRSEGHKVKLVYLTREPRAVMSSVMEYQRRNPHWYPHLKGAKLVKFMHRTYNIILEMFEHEPGLIIDYSSIRPGLAKTLQNIYPYLWSEFDNAEEISNAAAMATDRQKRSSTLFIGKAGPIRGNPKKYNQYFKEHKRELIRCSRCYTALLNYGEVNAKVQE